MAGEAGDGRRQQGARQGGGGRGLDVAGLTVAHRLGELVERGDVSPTMRSSSGSNAWAWGVAIRPAAIAAVEQRHAKIRFDLAETFAHGGLREMCSALPRFADRPEFEHRAQPFKLTEIHWAASSMLPGALGPGVG